MSCPICFNKPMNCDCTQEARQLYYLRQEMSENEDNQLTSKQAERRELFLSLAKLYFQICPEKFEGLTIRQIVEQMIKDADEFSKKDSHE